MLDLSKFGIIKLLNLKYAKVGYNYLTRLLGFFFKNLIKVKIFKQKMTNLNY
jgi:hypothetical protein